MGSPSSFMAFTLPFSMTMARVSPSSYASGWFKVVHFAHGHLEQQLVVVGIGVPSSSHALKANTNSPNTDIRYIIFS